MRGNCGGVPPDPDTRAVARALAPRLAQLSGERNRAELLRLLEAPAPLPVLEIMIGDGLLESILPEIAGTAVLASLLQLDLPEAADPVDRKSTRLNSSH